MQSGSTFLICVPVESTNEADHCRLALRNGKGTGVRQGACVPVSHLVEVVERSSGGDITRAARRVHTQHELVPTGLDHRKWAAVVNKALAKAVEQMEYQHVGGVGCRDGEVREA
jgi:hypothetical protein